LTSDTEGLGNRLIARQPLPIRLVLGSANMIVYPMPLWAGPAWGAGEYHWLKGYNGLFTVALMPLILVGFGKFLRQFVVGESQAGIGAFVIVFALAGAASVAATSLETRHFGQFLPAWMFLAGVPDLRDAHTRRNLSKVAGGWYGAIVVAHLAWAVLKFG
jgi:hypothetical protein